MAGATISAAEILPKELMELQLGQIDLLMAMYPSEDDVLLDDSCRGVLGSLRDWYDGTCDTLPPHVPSDLSLTLNLEVAEDPPRRLQLDITWPLRYEGAEALPSEPPTPKVRIRQPDWLSRAETSRLTAEIPPEDSCGDILGVLEHIRTAAEEAAAANVLSSNPSESIAASSWEEGEKNYSVSLAAAADPLVRAWFYFPSISTRAKRDDLVRHAPGYGLTGFLLAGKPGVLCLEGGSRAIDLYMRFIKTESWGDIPAHHKKVSERWRESLGESSGVGGGGGGPTKEEGEKKGERKGKRVFADMTEISMETLGGARRGERGNRNDLKVLEAWLGDRGLGEAFAKVLI